jgi:hypothetical protein
MSDAWRLIPSCKVISASVRRCFWFGSSSRADARLGPPGGVPKRSTGTGCKPVGTVLRRFESCPRHLAAVRDGKCQTGPVRATAPMFTGEHGARKHRSPDPAAPGSLTVIGTNAVTRPAVTRPPEPARSFARCPRSPLGRPAPGVGASRGLVVLGRAIQRLGMQKLPRSLRVIHGATARALTHRPHSTWVWVRCRCLDSQGFRARRRDLRCSSHEDARSYSSLPHVRGSRPSWT